MAGPDGLISYVTGGGGAKVEPISHCSALDAYGIGWSYSANGGAGGGSACGSATRPTSISQVFHFLLVTVNGTDVRFEVVGIDWGSDFKPYRSSSISVQ